jgi:hypothetical protein
VALQGVLVLGLVVLMSSRFTLDFTMLSQLGGRALLTQ